MTSAYDTLKEWLAGDKLERDKKQPDSREHPKAPTPPSSKDVTNTLTAMSLGTTPLPFVPDLLGLLADINMYKTEPETRTPENFAWTGVGLLPVVPGVVARATKAQISDIAEALKKNPELATDDSALWKYGRKKWGQGIFIDKYGNIKREISDAGVKLKDKDTMGRKIFDSFRDPKGDTYVTGGAESLLDIIEHPNIEKLKFSPYPEDLALYQRLTRRRPINVEINPTRSGHSGSYDDNIGMIEASGLNERDALGVLMHEVTHDIQDFQNLPTGGSSKVIQRRLKKYPDLSPQGKEVVVKTAKTYEPMLKLRGTPASYSDELSRLLYLNKLGEVEARAVGKRTMALQSYQNKNPELMKHLPAEFQNKTGEELANRYLDAVPFKGSYDTEEEFIYDTLFKNE